MFNGVKYPIGFINENFITKVILLFDAVLQHHFDLSLEYFFSIYSDISMALNLEFG